MDCETHREIVQAYAGTARVGSIVGVVFGFFCKYFVANICGDNIACNRRGSDDIDCCRFGCRVFGGWYGAFGDNAEFRRWNYHYVS